MPIKSAIYFLINIFLFNNIMYCMLYRVSLITSNNVDQKCKKLDKIETDRNENKPINKGC